MSGNYYFVIIGHHDNPIYEQEHSSRDSQSKKDDYRDLCQFVAHASLDMIDEHMWTTNNMYLKVVDKFNDWNVSAFVTAGKQRLVILHDVKNEDSIRQFFQEVYELYIKVAMNPFYEPNTPITSPQFHQKLKALCRRYLI